MDINKLCPGCMKEIDDVTTVKFCRFCGYNIQEDMSAPHQLSPKSILNGKYVVGKVIGEGGFGITYLGFDLNLEIPVAIKEYFPNGFVTRDSTITTTVTAYAGKNMQEFDKWRENFLKEARSLAKFSNLSGIVEVRDYFTENNTTYIVMEYIDGITMKEFLKSQGGKLSEKTVLTYMQPIIKSLGKVHATGIIHRDISPDNIMVEKSGEIKLLDFGAARDISSNAEKSLSVLLKLGYAPEEQYRTRGKQGSWSDVYAICATIYKCITGVTPVESIERIRDDSLKMPSELGVLITPNIEKALCKGLAVYAENRFQTMEELYAALYAGAPVTASIPSVIPRGVTEPSTGTHIGETINTGTQQVIHTETQQTALGRNQTMGVGVSGNNRKNMVIIGAAVGVVCIALICVVISLQSPSKKEASKIENTPATVEAVKEPPKEIEEDLTEFLKIEEQFKSTDNIDKKHEFMNQICEYIENNSVTETVKNMAMVDYDSYYANLQNYITMLENQPVSAAICTEMNLKFQNAIDTGEKLNTLGVLVDSGKIKTLKDESNITYKERWIQVFDQEAMDSMNGESHVVSHSTLWQMMDGATESGLFAVDDYHDELRQRYIVALTLYVDNELLEMTTREEQIAIIYENLKNTDYSPYLVYYLKKLQVPRGEIWYELIRPTLASIGGDFEYLSPQEQLNAVYNYNVVGTYAGARDKIRQILLKAKDE